MQIIGTNQQPAGANRVEDYISAARQQLGEIAFQALWEEGCAMSLEEAVAYALDEIQY
jgi:hypothetical protein